MKQTNRKKKTEIRQTNEREEKRERRREREINRRQHIYKLYSKYIDTLTFGLENIQTVCLKANAHLHTFQCEMKKKDRREIEASAVTTTTAIVTYTHTKKRRQKTGYRMMVRVNSPQIVVSMNIVYVFDICAFITHTHHYKRAPIQHHKQSNREPIE